MVITREAVRAADRRSARPEARSPLRAVALPTEHGGWSLTAEPVMLGLLTAWSLPGLALGVAAMVTFLARTPIKVVLVDTWRHRRLPRTRLAARVAAVEVTVIVALVAVATAGAARPFWWPLALAAPLAMVALWFDMRSRSRRALPEVAGTVAIASVAAAIAIAGGSGDRLAVGAWCVISARAVSAVPYVRTQVARARKGAASTWPSDLTQLGALGVVVVAWVADAVPLAGVVVVAAALGWQAVMLRAPVRPAVKIGLEQTVLGLTVVLVAGLALLAP